MANYYHPQLKERARILRKSMTEQEIVLWGYLRRRQILGIKFLRQKPFGQYVIDFYAPEIKVAIELDGSQHYEAANSLHDGERDGALSLNGIITLRYSNNDIRFKLKSVLDNIHFNVQSRLRS